jgi:hypothetical protein
MENIDWPGPPCPLSHVWGHGPRDSPYIGLLLIMSCLTPPLHSSMGGVDREFSCLGPTLFLSSLTKGGGDKENRTDLTDDYATLILMLRTP